MRTLPGLTSLDGTLTAFLDDNRHAFTRAELRSRWTRTALEKAVTSGAATRVLPGVYAARQHVADPRVRGEALNLWHPDGLVTGLLALHLYASDLPRPSAVQLRVPHGFRPAAPNWLRICQGEPQYRWAYPGGVRCTVPALALLDAWRLAPATERENLLWEALWVKVCTWRELVREVKKAPRIAGRRDLKRILGWFAAGAKSPLEVRAKYETFADARFREFAWQVDLRLASRGVTVDMLHQATKTVVELDGDKYHSTRDKRDDDRERQTLLVAAGYAVVRFGWRDVVDRPEWCRKQVLTTLASRSLRPARK